MSQPKTRKRLYTVLGLGVLVYTMYGCVLSQTTTDYPGPLSGFKYNRWEDPAYIGFIMLITGIPLFLLFVFLERRIKL